MNLVPVPEDEGTHLGIPVARLVAKMDARLQHLAHGYVGHGLFL
jgi:hypothetical protein